MMIETRGIDTGAWSAGWCSSVTTTAFAIPRVSFRFGSAPELGKRANFRTPPQDPSKNFPPGRHVPPRERRRSTASPGESCKSCAHSANTNFHGPPHATPPVMSWRCHLSVSCGSRLAVVFGPATRSQKQRCDLDAARRRATWGLARRLLYAYPEVDGDEANPARGRLEADPQDRRGHAREPVRGHHRGLRRGGP